MGNHRPTPLYREKEIAHLTAGHAVIAVLENLNVKYASIEPQDVGLSWPVLVEFDHSEPRDRCSSDTGKRIKSTIRALLAGPASQISYSFGYYPLEFNLAGRCILDQGAIWRAISLVGKVTDNGPALTHALWDEVMMTLGYPSVWTAIEKVAAALLDNRKLSDCELIGIVRPTMSQRDGARPADWA